MTHLTPKSEEIFRKLSTCKPKKKYFVEKVNCEEIVRFNLMPYGVHSNNEIKVLVFDKNGDVCITSKYGKFWLDGNLANKIIVRDNK